MKKFALSRLNAAVLKSLCSGSLAASLIASPLALAQEDETSDEAAVERVQVTGSRIAQDSSLEAASPVLAIDASDIKASGQLDLGALLRESPQLQASLPGSFSAFEGSPLGASLLDLRNLGDERTLVMENGRRHVAGIEGTGSVDVNTISTALLRNVEVLTGGASAVYGADAVTGVVNFNMRSAASFTGMEVRTQTGVSSRGDANEFFLSIANGVESDDGRGELVFAVEYTETSPVFARDRDFAGPGLATRVENNEATQQAFGIDPRFSNAYITNQTLPISSAGGVISLTGSGFGSVLGSGGTPGCSRLGNALVFECQYVDADGTVRPYNPGDVYIGPFEASGGDAVPVEPGLELILPETQRVLVQTVGKYELHENVTFFTDAKFVFSETKETNQVNGFNDDIPISLDNPFIPAALMADINALQAEGIDVNLAMSRDVLDLSASSLPEAERKTMRIVMGFEGYIPGTELEYELSYNYGRTDADITQNSRVEDRYFAAIDAVVDPDTGNTVCRSDIDNSAVPPTSPFPAQNPNFGFSTFVPGDGQCVPLNLFGENSITPEAAAFVFLPTVSQNDLKQENILAVVSGDSGEWFNLPAGPISFAAGYEWRRESSDFTPDNLVLSGLTFGSIESRGGITRPSSGTYSVDEFFIEAQIPILEGMTFAERLELRTAFRTSDYDPYGTNDAWTIGTVWSPVETLTIRTTLSEAVRVPNINEAFSPQTVTSLDATEDPCNPNEIDAGSEFRFQNCVALIGQSVTDGTYNSTNFLSAFVPGLLGGNVNLEPEEAETLTVGIVWNPDGDFGGLFDGLVVTLDYYDIQIDGLIDNLTGFDIAQNCVDAASLDNQFCDAIDRDPTNGFITGFRSGFINLAAVETSGIDFKLDYGFDFEGITKADSLSFTVNGTHFLSNDETRNISDPDDVTDVLTTFTRPEWIINANIDYKFDDWIVGWRGRYESSQFFDGIELQDIQSNPDFVNIATTGSAYVHDFSLSYSLTDELEVYGGINNAFDRDPFVATLARPAGPRGRFYFLGLNYTM